PPVDLNGEGPEPAGAAPGAAAPSPEPSRAPTVPPVPAAAVDATAPRRPPSTAGAAADREAVSSPELRSRLLAEALAHAEHKDARYRVPFSDRLRVRRRKTALALLLLLLAGGAWVLPPAWARPDPPPRTERAVRERDLRMALLLQAQQVEAYRVRNQALPDSLTVLGAALPGVRYVRSGNRAYQLVAYLPDGEALVYDSVDPSPEFEEVPRPWRLGEDGP
ncbi:MAG TPA: hypothetical protein VFQ22_05460, partial [Longimicrobiales bacterium]|nr:hypothetical protein [Longimicrobiales bacterium]